MTALLAEIDRHADALVPVVFDGFDFLFAHCHRLAIAFRHIGFAGRRAKGSGMREDIGGELAQALLGVAESLF